jgi:hypothetical protein
MDVRNACFPLLIIEVIDQYYQHSLLATNCISMVARRPAQITVIKRLFVSLLKMSSVSLLNLTVNYTLAIDLSSSFSTLAADNQVLVQVIHKGDCPNMNYPRFWVDEKRNRVYTYGGIYSYSNPWPSPASTPLEELWTFEPSGDTGTWVNIDQSFNMVWNSLTRPSEGAATFGSIGGFNLGGYHTSRSSQKTNIGGTIPSPGLQFYNFTDLSWTNNSALGYSDDGTSSFSTITWVPTWGPAGLLVAVGGESNPNLADEYSGLSFVPLNNISIFEPLTQTWYRQTATGDIPQQRVRACMVSVGSSDNSTHGKYSVEMTHTLALRQKPTST